MVELLILYLLFEDNNSTYGIKRLAEERFSLFFKFSFGTIHPALKRLQEKKYISVKKEISSGGQRKSTYSITDHGQKHFKELLKEELPDNPQLAEQLICIKIMALNKIDKEIKLKVIENIIKYYEISIIESKEVINSEYVKLDNRQKGWIQTKIKNIEQKIYWLETT